MIKKLLFAFIACVLPFAAFADDHGISLVETTLAPPVTSLSFYCASGFTNLEGQASGVYIYDKSDTEFDEALSVGSSWSTRDSNTYLDLTLNSSYPITDTGDYCVVLRSYSMYLGGTELTENVYLYFTVAESTGEEDTGITLNPAGGSTVTSLKTITVSYADGLAENRNASFSISGGSGSYTVSCEGDEGTFDSSNYVYGSYTLTISPEITDEGTYTLTIGSGTFSMGTDYPAPSNEEITATYTVGSGGSSDATFVYTPGSGDTVGTLSTITIKKGSDEGDEIECESSAKVGQVTVTASGASSATATGSSYSTTGDAVVITLSTTVSDAGDYTIYIPEDVVWYSIPNENDENDIIENESVSYTVHVTGDESDNPDTSVTFTPAEGAQLSSLSEITAYCAAGIEPAMENGTGLKVYPKDDDEAVASSYSATTDANGTTCTVKLTPTVSADGYYVIDIPEGFFTLGTAAEDSRATTINVTIGNPSDEDDANANVASSYSFSPASGATLEPSDNDNNFCVINNKVKFSTVYNRNDNSNPSVTADDITIKNENGEVVAQGRGDRLNYSPVSSHEVEFFTYKPTTNSSYTGVSISSFDPGTYTITVPAGLIVLDTGETNPELTSTYTIRDTSSDPTFTIDPENHSSFTSLEYVTVTSDQEITVSGIVSQILIADAAGSYSNSVKSYELSNDKYSCKLYFTTTIKSTDMSTALNLIIPAGFFSGQTDDIDVTYFLGDGSDEESPVFSIEDDGKEMTDIYEVVINCTKPFYKEGLSAALHIYLSGPEGFEAGDDEDGKVYATTCEAVSEDDDNNSYIATLERIVSTNELVGDPAGEYTFTIDGGFFATGYTTYEDDIVATFKLVESEDSTGDDTTGISSVKAAISDGAQVYTLSGQRVTTPVKGTVRVVRNTDGTVKKVVMK